jgi:hypothetical protein
MAAPRSAAVQIVRPSSPTAGTGASEGAVIGKKGKLAYCLLQIELTVDGNQKLCRNVLIYGYVHLFDLAD